MQALNALLKCSYTLPKTANFIYFCAIMKLRLVILDPNAGTPNQGIRCINQIVSQYKHQLDVDIFDVGVTGEVPDLSYDLYIQWRSWKPHWKVTVSGMLGFII